MGLLWLALIGWAMTQGNKVAPGATDQDTTDTPPENQTRTMALPQPTADVLLNDKSLMQTTATPSAIVPPAAPSAIVPPAALRPVWNPQKPLSSVAQMSTAKPAANPNLSALANFATADKQSKAVADAKAAAFKKAAEATWGSAVVQIPGTPLRLSGGASISSKLMWYSTPAANYVRDDGHKDGQTLTVKAIRIDGTATTTPLPGRWVKVPSKVWLA